jgi:hypothetical protein
LEKRSKVFYPAHVLLKLESLLMIKLVEQQQPSGDAGAGAEVREVTVLAAGCGYCLEQQLDDHSKNLPNTSQMSAIDCSRTTPIFLIVKLHSLS